MGYFWFFLLVCSSFVMASEPKTQGYVYIVGAKNPQYDRQNREIPGSKNVVLNIKNVQHDANTGSVSLFADQNDSYDMVHIVFNSIDYKDLSAVRLKSMLTENSEFKLFVRPEDLKFDSTQFASTLSVDARNVIIKPESQTKVVALQEILCPTVTKKSFFGPEVSFKLNCL